MPNLFKPLDMMGDHKETEGSLYASLGIYSHGKRGHLLSPNNKKEKELDKAPV